MAGLRHQREAMGLSLEEAAAKVRIPQRYLSALEQGDPSAFPPGPFLSGYKRQYLAFLGLPADALPELVAPEPAPEPEPEPTADLEPELTSTTSTIPRAEEIPVARLVITGFILTLALVLGLRVGSQMLDQPKSEGGITAPAVLPLQVSVRAVEPVRLTVEADGTVAHKGTLPAGETLQIEGSERVIVDLKSSLDDVVVHFDGDLIEPLHSQSEGRRLVFIRNDGA